MALSDEWKDVMRARWGEERVIAEHGTVKRSHAERLLDFKPDLAEELQAKPCLDCSRPRGVFGLVGARCQACEEAWVRDEVK